MRKTTPQFDFEEALEALKSGRDLNGKDGILTPLIKQLTEAALAAELEQHIKSTNEQNRKNGATPKTVKSASGSFQLDTPRDRNGTFEPQLIKKHQTHLTDEIERKILSLFALGSSYQDISGHISEIYGTFRRPRLAQSRTSLFRSLENGSSGHWIVTIRSFGWMPYITK